MYSMPKIVLGSVSNMRIWFAFSSTLFSDASCSVDASMVSDVFLPEMSSVFIGLLTE